MIRLLRATYLVAVLLALASHSAFAADLPPRSVVRIVIAGGRSTTTHLFASRLERTWQTLDATIITTFTPAMNVRDVLAPAAQGDTARVWIDLREPHAATIFVVEAGNIFERRLSFEQGLDNVALELLDVVTTSTVQAVLAGGHLGVTREEFTQSLPTATVEPAQPPVAADPASVTLAVGVTWQAALVASDKLTYGPGIQAQLQWERVRFGFELRGRFPFHVGNGSDTLSLAPEGFRLGVGRVVALRRSLILELSLSTGLDATRVRASFASSDVEAKSPFWSVTPVLSPLLRFEYAIEKLRTALLLGGDLDFWSTSYVVSASPTKIDVWTPWQLRPVAGLAMAYGF